MFRGCNMLSCHGSSASLLDGKRDVLYLFCVAVILAHAHRIPITASTSIGNIIRSRQPWGETHSERQLWYSKHVYFGVCDSNYELMYHYYYYYYYCVRLQTCVVFEGNLVSGERFHSIHNKLKPFAADFLWHWIRLKSKRVLPHIANIIIVFTLLSGLNAQYAAEYVDPWPCLKRFIPQHFSFPDLCTLFWIVTVTGDFIFDNISHINTI